MFGRLTGSRKWRRIAEQRGPASAEQFVAKLGPDAEPEVALIAFRHWQEWVADVRDFPVMPDDTFEFYGCVGEDVHDKCAVCATHRCFS